MTSFNKSILNSEIQDFINNHVNSDIAELALKGLPFPDHLKQDIITQIEAKKRCEKKLSTWFNTPNIYFPSKLNIEQTSSEVTAQYKANLVSGQSLIDLTGGFGVDSLYFSKKVNAVIHCDINKALSNIAEYNASVLQVKNIEFYASNGIEVLSQTYHTLDWIYVDPSRRDDLKGKVFLLKECLPNIPEHLTMLFKHSKNILIKTSPLLDISSGINELQNVKTIHCVAVNNEVKELLWVLEENFKGDIEIRTSNLKNGENQQFNFILNNENIEDAEYSLPLTYLYEPNAAILKSGAFNSVANTFNIYKLHKHSHLYTSTNLINFPGRIFKIDNTINYNKKEFTKHIGFKQANVTSRNFPEAVTQIRKKLKIKDGGKHYLFFTTDLNHSKIVISCSKL
ncbi:class I SAM-dependent methyltransferase [Olleya sp. HaHaR_3_96]|uniref:class I SAM-dependent methyltransferase n=1 Tax=Olleya sp. HaHaR_3_96 TaxID=2745560 RepID=UPI001C4F60ED|nr:class I SAM-dependent methyltransferase [Olleya sp. HaHaR_3_96]QXP58611.1 class I SAM-dependent methyltransferase [Olleya sp. HaHaR_3_96]